LKRSSQSDDNAVLLGEALATSPLDRPTADAEGDMELVATDNDTDLSTTASGLWITGVLPMDLESLQNKGFSIGNCRRSGLLLEVWNSSSMRGLRTR
jgi:hypothetical protein